MPGYRVNPAFKTSSLAVRLTQPLLRVARFYPGSNAAEA